jgi:hypothetical protein
VHGKILNHGNPLGDLWLKGTSQGLSLFNRRLQGNNPNYSHLSAIHEKNETVADFQRKLKF